MSQIKALVSEQEPFRIDISRYPDYTRLVRVTARVLAMFRTDYKPSFRNAARVLEPVDVTKAE